MTTAEIAQKRQEIAEVRGYLRTAARSGRVKFSVQDDSTEGVRLQLNACYLHRATGGEGYGFKALQAWNKRCIGKVAGP
jgi:hypothetical protein